MAITNAFVIYKMNNTTSLQKAQTNRQFRLTLAEKLVTGIVASHWGPGCPHTQSISHLTAKHFLYRHGTKQRCCVCVLIRKNHLEVKKYKDKNCNMVRQMQSAFVYRTLF